MKPSLAAAAALGILTITATVQPSLAAGNGTEVRVALLDMSANMGHGPAGGWGMGPGNPMMGGGPGRFGPGWGMMSGYGPGWGMMGPGGNMMGRMAIRTDHASLKAGEVHFTVTNWSQAIVHEMIVVAVDNPDAPLPYDYNTGRVAEDQIKTLGEVSGLRPNATGTLDVNLTPGSYLLICNVPGHYAAGMVTDLTVTP